MLEGRPRTFYYFRVCGGMLCTHLKFHSKTKNHSGTNITGSREADKAVFSLYAHELYRSFNKLGHECLANVPSLSAWRNLFIYLIM